LFVAEGAVMRVAEGALSRDEDQDLAAVYRAALGLAFHAFRAALSYNPDNKGLARGEFVCRLALEDESMLMGRLSYKEEEAVREQLALCIEREKK
jgi:hypothetical protein